LWGEEEKCSLCKLSAPKPQTPTLTHPFPPLTTQRRQDQKRTHQKALQILISFENQRRPARKRRNPKKVSQRGIERQVIGKEGVRCRAKEKYQLQHNYV